MEYPASAAPTLPVRLTLGAAGGIIAGAGFAALNLWFATVAGKGTLAPFSMISTILLGPPLAEGVVWLGLMIHIVLSVTFGVVFALLTHPWGIGTTATLAGLVYGGAIYVINFQILSRVIDYWGAFIQETNQPFELASHLVFGAILAVFFPAVTRNRTEVSPQAAATPHTQNRPGRHQRSENAQTGGKNRSHG